MTRASSSALRGAAHRPGIALAAACLLLGACSTRPELATVAVQPTTAPVRNIGSFNEALRCMDDLFLAQGKRDIYITTAGIPDATGLIAAGTKEMFISAVSKMSAKSNAFQFVDYDVTQTDVQILSELVGLRQDFVAPSYYVRGAITQLDSGVLSANAKAAVSLPDVDLAVSGDQVVSIISMDLNVGRLVTRQIIPGISAENSIAVIQSGKGADVGGMIGKAGVALSVSINRSEGFHQAVRSLVELSTIEVLGKLTRVPYWQCLKIESTNPTFKAEARDWFDGMSANERDQFVRAALVRTGYLRTVDASSTELSEAIARYQAENDLVANGRLDFEIYYRLLASAGRSGTVTAASLPQATPPEATTAATATQPRLLLGTVRGPQPVYRVGETMTVQVQPSADAFVYCYYQDAGGHLARIFPNRFQPDPFVRARKQVEIPPPASQSFSIQFEHGGASEAVSCLAAAEEVGLRLPAELKTNDLTPIAGQSLESIAAAFQAAAKAPVDVAQMRIGVVE